MTRRRLALIRNGRTENVIVADDSPGGASFLAAISADYDHVVELRDGEMCEPGARVSAAGLDAVDAPRFERAAEPVPEAALVEALAPAEPEAVT